MRIWYFIHLFNTVNSEVFAKVLFSRNFREKKLCENSKNPLSFTDVSNGPSREFSTRQICRLTLFAITSHSTECVVIVHGQLSSRARGIIFGLSHHPSKSSLFCVCEQQRL